MRTIITTVLILVFSCCQPPKENNEAEEQIKKVETSLGGANYIIGDSLWTIEERMKHYGVPGVSLAVISEGKIAWTKTYGIMDKETNDPVTSETLFQAGSISKPVAAYAALKAVELGKIEPETDVNSYLVSWKIPENEFTQQKSVTLKHLLSHTGGLTVHGFLGYSPDLPVPTVIQVLNGAPPANSPAILVDKLPGAGFRYSGGGYTIMQQTLIDIEHRPFPEILDTWVIKPLGMSHSTYNQPLLDDQLAHAATGYLPNGSQTKGKRHTYPEMAAAGLWTTAEDLAKFAIDIQQTYRGNNSKVLSQQTVQLMLTPYIENFVGLGIFIDNHDGEIYFQHGGWDEGFSSQLMAHRDKGVGAVVLTNSNHPPFIDELIRSVAFVYQWPNYVKSYEEQAVSSAEKERIMGNYKYDSDEVVKIYSEGDRLFFKYLRSEPMELFKVSDSSYIRKERAAAVMFPKNEKDGKQYISFDSDDVVKMFTRPRMAADDKVPYEYILDGDVNRAVTAYQDLKKKNPDDPASQESTINGNGYNVLNNNPSLAALIFKVNTILYPTSANVYDSYADALIKLGEKKAAIDNYKKALSIDPALSASKTKLDNLLKDGG